jgi:hypothetical protein
MRRTSKGNVFEYRNDVSDTVTKPPQRPNSCGFAFLRRRGTKHGNRHVALLPSRAAALDHLREHPTHDDYAGIDIDEAVFSQLRVAQTVLVVAEDAYIVDAVERAAGASSGGSSDAPHRVMMEPIMEQNLLQELRDLKQLQQT